MCMYPTHKRPKRATEDMKVYKCLIKCDRVAEGRQAYKSPVYHDTTWHAEETKKTRIKKVPPPWPRGYWGHYGKKIGKALHAFTTPNSLRLFMSTSKRSCVPCEMTIPKGAKYYLGDDGDIASNRMRLDREMSESEFKRMMIVN